MIHPVSGAMKQRELEWNFFFFSSLQAVLEPLVHSTTTTSQDLDVPVQAHRLWAMHSESSQQPHQEGIHVVTLGPQLRRTKWIVTLGSWHMLRITYFNNVTNTHDPGLRTKAQTLTRTHIYPYSSLSHFIPSTLTEAIFVLKPISSTFWVSSSKLHCIYVCP